MIGENLASDTLYLDEPQRSQWIQLTGLAPASGKGGDGMIECSSVSTTDPLLNGRFGNVSSFAYATNVDLATLANTNTSVLGQSGSAANVLVVNPATENVDAGQPGIVTQDFRVDSGVDPDSLAQRKALFMNAVCWLVNCSKCGAVGLSLSSGGTAGSAALGQPLTYCWTVNNNGECDGTGTIFIGMLPPGTSFIGAEAPGGTWAYDTNRDEVVFRFGLLAHGTMPSFCFTVLPLLTGQITNSVSVSANGSAATTDQLVTQVNGLSLLWSGGTNYLLELTGDAGQAYKIQTSPDLLQWADWTNVTGPLWMTPLLDPLQTNFNRRFYRANAQ